MRVLQLVTQDRGGPVDAAVEVAAELARLGHDSHLAGPGPFDRASQGGVTVHPVAIRTATDLEGVRGLADLVARLEPDVLHLQDRRAGLAGRAVAVRRGLPSVYTLHGVPDELAGLVPGNLAGTAPRARDRVRYLWAERQLARAARSVVVTPCDALARYARDHVGVPGERVRTVPNGIGPEWLVGSDGPPERTGHRVRATWLGVMQPVKRVPDLVRAAARVPDLELLLVGDGPERPRVERAVAETGCADRVHLAGHHCEPRPLLRTSDMVVLPSAAEACPMALLQAMACGLPVVATDVGGVAEVVRDGVDGLLVPPGDDEALVAALGTLARDPALRRDLGAAGRSRVAERFDVRSSARALLSIYEELAA